MILILILLKYFLVPLDYLLKIHKTSISICLIINYTSSFLIKLSEFLSDLLKFSTTD